MCPNAWWENWTRRPTTCKWLNSSFSFWSKIILTKQKGNEHSYRVSKTNSPIIFLYPYFPFLDCWVFGVFLSFLWNFSPVWIIAVTFFTVTKITDKTNKRILKIVLDIICTSTWVKTVYSRFLIVWHSVVLKGVKLLKYRTIRSHIWDILVFFNPITFRSIAPWLFMVILWLGKMRYEQSVRGVYCINNRR